MKFVTLLQKYGVISNGVLQSRKFLSFPSYSKKTAVFHLFTKEKSAIRKWNKQILENVQQNVRLFRTSAGNSMKDTATITFVDRNGEKVTVEADIGDTLLDVAKDNDIDGVEGACGGTLACSTCHCIFKQDDFDRLELNEITEDELDMLDLAYGLTDTSRLVCALDVTEEMDGLEITVPVATNDARDI